MLTMDVERLCMSTWQVEQNFYARHLLEHFELDGYLVKVHNSGSFPRLINQDGVKDEDTPVIEIILEGGETRRVPYYIGAHIRVTGEGYHDEGGYKRSLVTWSKRLEHKVQDPTALIAEAKQHLAFAVVAVNQIDDTFISARKRIAESHRFTVPFRTQDEYAQACRQCNVPQLSDTECEKFGRYLGLYTYPQYDATFIIATRLAALRLDGMSMHPQSIKQQNIEDSVFEVVFPEPPSEPFFTDSITSTSLACAKM
jgi:hypothetical protein